MKAVIAVVQGDDTGRVSTALRQNDIRFTTIDSTGGFLRERDTEAITKPRIQRSFSSNSGSVLKSQLMWTSSPPRVTLRRCPTYV